MKMGFATLTAMLAAPAAAHAAEPRTAAAVIAADDAWLAAEVKGDADALDKLLLPAYRSIGAGGKATTKGQLVANARKRGADPKMAAEVAKWKAAHPSRADVAITGDTAVLTWTLTGGDGSQPVSSSDVFVYVDGGWHALYSQHSTAAS